MPVFSADLSSLETNFDRNAEEMKQQSRINRKREKTVEFQSNGFSKDFETGNEKQELSETVNEMETETEAERD